MKHFLAAALILAPVAAFAAGSTSSNPPTSTHTTNVCEEGFVWDLKTKACIKADETGHMSDEALYDVVRELAYNGRLEDAQIVLSAMHDQDSDAALTYWGFTHRKLGNGALATAFYDRALEQNPDNLLARSYRAQGYVAEGMLTLAKAELSEINARGGSQTWASWSLKQAIASGKGYSY